MANLHVFTVETKDGSIYKFPDVDVTDFKFECAITSDASALTLVNASGAVLVVPSRIIKELRVCGPDANEEVWWKSSHA